MKSAFVAISIVVLLGNSLYAGNGSVMHHNNPRLNSYIVVLQDGVTDDIDVLKSDFVEMHGAKSVYVWKHALKGFTFEMNAQQAAMVSRDPRVKIVEEDGLVNIAGAAPGWNTDRIDTRMSPRLDGIYDNCSTGLNVRAYVVDTGIWKDHDEFSNLVGGVSRVAQGWDYQQARYGGANQSVNPPCGTDTSSYNGSHGTAVASILGGRTMGAAPEVTLVSVRVGDCGARIYSSELISGLNWILQDPGYLAGRGRVVNMSHVSILGNVNPDGTTIDVTGIEVAVQGLLNNGITVVAAAGNFNEPIANKYSPARMPGIITVGASKGQNSNDVDLRWDDGPTGNTGSNYGPAIDVFAPGDHVVCAYWSSSTARRDQNDAGRASGTSFAAPLVAGVAARYLSVYPTENCDQIAARIVTNATTDVHGLNMTNRYDSPNRLLYMPYDCRRRP